MRPAPFFIGSLPHQTPEEALQFVHKHSSHLPFLPQLPEANPQEDMIGQILRGFELGHWDEKASSCLELFQNDFADAPRCKIQLAGPYAVAKSMSAPIEKVIPQWLRFWEGLKTQLRHGAFRGELWLQLDEPYWSKENDLPLGYERFLEVIRNSRAHLKLGIHSCATHRPAIRAGLLELLDFFSFDFTTSPMTEEEQSFWHEVLSMKKHHLVYGSLSKDGSTSSIPPSLNEFHDLLFLSAPCGLYGWNNAELERL